MFKESSLNNKIAPISNSTEENPVKVYKTEEKRFKLAENKWVDSMPVSVLNLSKVVRGELELYIKKNFSGKQIEEVTIGEIIKNYPELKKLWRNNYFNELEAEVKHCQDLSTEFLNNNKN